MIQACTRAPLPKPDIFFCTECVLETPKISAFQYKSDIFLVYFQYVLISNQIGTVLEMYWKYTKIYLEYFQYIYGTFGIYSVHHVYWTCTDLKCTENVPELYQKCTGRFPVYNWYNWYIISTVYLSVLKMYQNYIRNVLDFSQYIIGTIGI